MVWVIFGTKEVSKRVPGGAQITRTCDSCGERATFYEKDLTSTLRLYFIDVLDYRTTRVMQCGACGACYGTDELGARDESLVSRLEKRLEEGGQVLGRVASTVGDKLTGLAADAVGRPRPPSAPPPREAPKRPDKPDDLSDDDIAAWDELEAKFRALEKADDDKRRR